MMRRLRIASLFVLAAACAHVDTAAPRQTSSRSKPAARMLVTGSRIPRPIDPATGQPQTVDSVRIYTRDRLADTGRNGNLVDALRVLDPSF
jgi:hypothetical protein